MKKYLPLLALMLIPVITVAQSSHPYSDVITLEMFGGGPSCDPDLDGTINIADRDDWLDNSPAMSAALTYLQNNRQDSVGRIYIPSGCYWFEETVDIDRPVYIEGSYRGHWGGTRLFFDNDVMGFSVWGDTTTSRENANGTTLENLRIQSRGGTSTAAHGVQIGTRMYMKNVLIEDFPGNGLMAWCDTVGAGAPDGLNSDTLTHSNCNNSNFFQSEFVTNKQWGVYMKDNDSNASEFYSCNFQGNDSGDIYEDSFLGNSYYGGHITSDNGQKGGDCDDPYVAGDEVVANEYCSVFGDSSSNRSMFYGMYTEGSGEWRLDRPAAVMGNTHGGEALYKGTMTGMTGADLTGGYIDFYNKTSTTSVRLGQGITGDAWAAFGVHPESNHPNLSNGTDYIRFGANPEFDSGLQGQFDGMYGWCLGNTRADCFHFIAGTDSVSTDAQDGDASYFLKTDTWIKGRLWLGNNGTNETTANKLIFDICDDAAPTTTTAHTQGSICYNTGTSTHAAWVLNGSTWQSWARN